MPPVSAAAERNAGEAHGYEEAHRGLLLSLNSDVGRRKEAVLLLLENFGRDRAPDSLSLRSTSSSGMGRAAGSTRFQPHTKLQPITLPDLVVNAAR